MASAGGDHDDDNKLLPGQENDRSRNSEMPEGDEENKNIVEQEDNAVNTSKQPPALSRRPTTIEEEDDNDNEEHTTPTAGSLTLSKGIRRPRLQSKATTAVSQVEIQGLEGAGSSPGRSRSQSRRRTSTRMQSSEDEDSASILSVQPLGSSQGGDVESLLGEALESSKAHDDNDGDQPLEETLVENTLDFEHDDLEDTFPTEFNPVEGDSLTDAEGRATGGAGGEGREEDEEGRAARWRAKLKHYLILSSAGKPIYSRHGDDQVISGTIGVVQTIISFYQSTQDTLKGFTAGNARFAILSKGHLHLLAVSRLGESDGQLRTQLEALYMQILSTLTLPTMERLFINRPSTDLRRPLQGTENLISSLADGFTRGSPSVLLSALECLRIRKAHRQIIHSTLLKCRSPNLLYGLLVADGRLAAVVRPKKHSLHPGDLQLIFNMLFEADSIRAGGGESWIPVCLPGFNNTGYLYMYVSFLDAETAAGVEAKSGRQEEVAVVLISANGEAFDELRGMRDKLVSQLQANGSLAHIRRAMANGRSSCTSILQTNQPKGKQDQAVDAIAHFLYKSRANVQFVMPSAAPLFATAVRWRRLMNLYGRLQASLHAKHSHLKLIHIVTTSATALAWTTPTFEIYVVAGRGATRPMLARAASGIVEWARREEERLFVVGGAVF